MSYGGSNPPLCTTLSAASLRAVAQVGRDGPPTALCPSHLRCACLDLSPGGSGRLLIALAVLALLAAVAWFTMEPGRYRDLTFVLLGVFCLSHRPRTVRSR